MEQTELFPIAESNPTHAGSAPENPWDFQTLRSRIDQVESRTRFEAGSPDKAEVALYRKALRTLELHADERQVLILGMTPEIRQMALEQGCRVTSVDRSAEAIALYADWVGDELKTHEAIVEDDWFAIDRILPQKVDGILGDGVFGNILTVEGHRSFLGQLKSLLRPGGVLILRQALIPHGFSADDYEALTLVNQFRSGSLSQAEFGFAMRLWGSFASAYDPASFLLDNAIVFARYQEWAAQSVLNPRELELIHRYYFGGANMLLPQRLWESMLTEAGFEHRIEPLAGKAWYAYYPLYVCHVPNA